MTTSTDAIEESIKIALDAADTATSVTAEFETIRAKYDTARNEVKKVNRHALGIFASSVIAILISVGAAGFMYYRTLGEMQQSNTTTLEALLIFAENVDKLVLAVEKFDTLEDTNAKLLSALQSTTASLDGLSASITAQPDAVSNAVMGAMMGPDGAVETMAARVVGAVENAASAQAEAMATATASLGQTLETKLANLQTAATASPGNEEMITRLDAITLLQQEVSAKLTATQSRPAPMPTPATPRPTARTTPRAPAAPAGDVIKFP